MLLTNLVRANAANDLPAAFELGKIPQEFPMASMLRI
jgi:hypothetical protein